MARRTPLAQSRHNQMVQEQARALRRAGYLDVRADDIGWCDPNGALAAPAAIHGHVPDVTGLTLYGQLLIVEVETGDSLPLDETRRQWATFSAHARLVGGRVRILVPAEYEAAARRLSAQWAINVDEFYVHTQTQAA